MMRALGILILLAAMATGLAWLIDLQGGLLLSVGPYQIETSLAVAALAILALATALAIVWATIRFVTDIPARINRYYAGRKRDKGYQAITRGMMAIGMGDRKIAERASHDAVKFLGAEPLVLLLQAQSAQLSGDKPQAERIFRAMLSHEDSKLLGLRGLFIEAQRRGDHSEALAFAKQAHEAQPALGWAHEALLEWHAQQQDWAGALALLHGMRKHIDKAHYHRQRAVLLTAHAQNLAHQHADEALDRAQEAVKLAPDLVPANLLVASLLATREDFRKASRLLEACWSLSPHPDIARAYIHLRHGDSPNDRLTRAEVLTRSSPELPDSRYALARAALEARDFPRARSLLAPDIAHRPTTRLCLLMAKLEQLEHHDPSAAQIWLARASRAPRDAAWIADGLVSDHWMAVSPVSGRLDSFQWMHPQEAISQAEPLDLQSDITLESKAKPEPQKPILQKPIPTNPAAQKAGSRSGSAVVFPLATSPDDPGPVDDTNDEDRSETGTGSSKTARPVHLFGG